MAALRVLQVNVRVNAAGNNQQARGLKCFGATQALSQRGDFAALDGDIGLKSVPSHNDRSVSDH